jgi:hypothetical protein
MNWIQILVIGNGIYDILCGFSILHIIKNSFFETIHTSMFIENKDETFKQSLAYYILLNGFVRILGGIYIKHNTKLLILSYLLESIFVVNETYVNKSIIKIKGDFVIITSIMFALLVGSKNKVL